MVGLLYFCMYYIYYISAFQPVFHYYLCALIVSKTHSNCGSRVMLLFIRVTASVTGSVGPVEPDRATDHVFGRRASQSAHMLSPAGAWRAARLSPAPARPLVDWRGAATASEEHKLIDDNLHKIWDRSNGRGAAYTHFHVFPLLAGKLVTQ